MSKTTSHQVIGRKVRTASERKSGAVSRKRPVRDRESERFVRKMVWVCVICGLFVAGQAVRYGSHVGQLREIQKQTDALYVSALDSDIGQSPYGRLQFEHGKLAAGRRIGLDPLSVLAALSRPAVESLRLEGLSVTGRTGRVRGFFGPNVDDFDKYVSDLSGDERFHFSLEKRDDVFGGIEFSLRVEPI
ncbi:MAG: hypothetical protein ABIK45_12645 [Pseudomonadota bacterium]